MNSLNFNREIIVLFIIYLLANLFFLLNFQGIYWDDWTLYHHSFDVIMSQFNMNGGVIAGYIHNILLNIGNGVFIYRVLVFISFFMSGYFIYKIILKCFNKEIAFWISLLYLLLPLNSAKIALINSPAVFLLFLFFLSFYLLTIYLENKRKIYLRIIILLLFFISFFLNSLLVFYIIVLIYIIFYYYRNYKKIDKTFVKYIFKNIDFLLLPIIFFIIKNIYFKPYGLYEGYNKVSLNLYQIFHIGITTFQTSFFEPIIISLKTSFNNYYLFFVAFLIIYKFLGIKNIYHILNTKKSLYLILGGIVLFVIGFFPYAAVGKTPRLELWWSRHQVLLPLGVAFILYGFVNFISFSNKKIFKLLLIIFVSIFTIQNLYYGYRYIKDYYYQISIRENLKDNDIIKSNTTFTVDESDLKGVLANKRTLNFYQLNGISRDAYNNSRRFFIRLSDLKYMRMYLKYRNYKQYNFNQWKHNGHIFVINIKRTDRVMNLKNLFTLLYEQIFEYKAFLRDLKQYTTLNISEFKSEK